ncbi:hypothetical protein Gohar_022072 [Gossypium harknessii]|uniref:Uncharacterized protein n=1 Tax=Gossypium harknessii TaxID=34285 RepID=A0A7J9I7C2_9ROSI|nr:hypothetical protein [Gossypium harknessii]
MITQILTFQSPVSVTLHEFLEPTHRYKVQTQQYQLSSVIVATPIAVYQSFHSISFLITVNISPSTDMSWKLISSTIIIAYKHALASAMVGSEIFSHG